MSTWLKLLPLELQELDKLSEPDTQIKPGDHEVGVMSDDLKKLYSLYRSVDRASDQAKLDYRHSLEEERAQLVGRAAELDKKAEVLRELFWIGVNDEFNLWSKRATGIRKGWKVVWYTREEGPLGRLMDLFG